MARPLAEVNEDLLKKLTKLHLSDKVIADILEISLDTLNRRFADKMEKWRSESKGKMAEVLFDEAINKREPWALKSLAQKHLDYSDKIKTENTNTNFNTDTDETLDAKIEEKIKKLKGDK